MSGHTPRIETTESSFLATAAEVRAGTRCPVEVRVTVADPYDAYRRARGANRRTTTALGSSGAREASVYLETTGGQPGWGYFAVDPIRSIRVGASAEPVDTDRKSVSLAELRAVLESERLVRGDCDVPYPCCAVGWLSYDVARELEALPDRTVDDRGLPRLQLGVFDRVAAWEEPQPGEETTLRVTACPVVGTDPATAYARGLERALTLARAAVAGEGSVGPPPVRTDDATFENDCSRTEYAERVRRVREYVRDGETFQANVSQRLRAPAAVHPVEAFAALRRVNPAPYSALVEFPGVDLVSASPELLLDVGPTVDGGRARDGGGTDTAVDGHDLDGPEGPDGRDEQSSNRRVHTEPIAGTRPRGETAAEDAAYERDLLADEKERAEHAMLVDLERNDLGKVSAYGTVTVPEYRRVDRYAEVMHLVSSVEGRLAGDQDLVDAVAATFPGGTITGVPKPRTMAIIDELEETRRGPYTGSIGLFGFDGRATLNIVIRTLVRRRAEYFLRVGAGIVHDSDPMAEYEETLDKARALLTALDEAIGDRADLTVASETGGHE